VFVINLLKPTGHVIHPQFKTVRSGHTVLCVLCLSEKKQHGTDWVFKLNGLRLCHLQHKLIGFYNRDEKCLERGTGWALNEAVCACATYSIN
jgi:hypothetical protein